MSIILTKFIKLFHTLPGLLIKDSGIEYNKQLNVIKIEPEKLCDTNFLSTEETETTCNTSKSQQKSKKHCSM